MKKTTIILWILILTICTASRALAFGAPEDRSVTDYAGLLSDSAKDYIQSKNEILFAHTKAKILFVTVEDSNNNSTEEYAKQLYADRNLNEFGRGNSVFILLSKNNNDYFLIQGKNIAYTLTDKIINDSIVSYFEPDFSKGNYDLACLKLYNALGKWYEKKYYGLNLSLDDNPEAHVSAQKTKYIEKSYTTLWIIIGGLIALILLIVALRVKRNIEFRIRQHQRKLLRKKLQLNLK